VFHLVVYFSLTGSPIRGRD